MSCHISVLGAVLLLDPVALSRQGAEPSPAWSGDRAVRGPHYFVVLARSDDWVLVCPAFSRALPGRLAVHSHEKYGDPRWREGVSYIDPRQLWRCPIAGLVRCVRRSSHRGGVRCTALQQLGVPLTPMNDNKVL